MKGKNRTERIIRKQVIKGLILAAALALSALSCKQSPIFFNISNEIAPKDPKIAGAPSKIAAITDASAPLGLKDRMFVARRYIYSYGITNTWEKMYRQPGGYVVDIAATKEKLYALTIDPFQLWEFDGSTWSVKTNLSSYTSLQGIFATDNRVFAAGAIRSTSSETYAILCYDGSTFDSIKEGMGSNGRLTGAVEVNGYYYLATTNDGVYAVSSSHANVAALKANFPAASLSSTDLITGIIADKISTPEKVLTVSRSGKIAAAQADGTTSFSVLYSDTDGQFNGALALAELGQDDILMIGYESGTDIYNFGYREIVLADGKLPDTISGLQMPGTGSVSSINISDKSTSEYKSSLGKHIIQSIIRTPPSIDSSEILFASTYKEGLWSYRDQVWNAEE